MIEENPHDEIPEKPTQEEESQLPTVEATIELIQEISTPAVTEKGLQPELQPLEATSGVEESHEAVKDDLPLVTREIIEQEPVLPEVEMATTDTDIPPVAEEAGTTPKSVIEDFISTEQRTIESDNQVKEPRKLQEESKKPGLIQTVVKKISDVFTKKPKPESLLANNLSQEDVWLTKNIYEEAEVAWYEQQASRAEEEVKSPLEALKENLVQDSFWLLRPMYDEAEELWMVEKEKSKLAAEESVKLPDVPDKDDDDNGSSGNSSPRPSHGGPGGSGEPTSPYLMYSLPGGIAGWKETSTYLSEQIPVDQTAINVDLDDSFHSLPEQTLPPLEPQMQQAARPPAESSQQPKKVKYTCVVCLSVQSFCMLSTNVAYLLICTVLFLLFYAT